MADRTQENLDRIRACDADWNENDHPRADNGQFTSGSGGGGAKVSKLQSGGKAKVQQLKNVSGALAGVNAGIEKAKKTAASQFKSNMARGEKLKADVDKDIQNLWDNHQKDWRYGNAYGRLKNKPGMEGLAERVKEKGKGLMKEYSDKYDKLMQKKQDINEEYGPDGRRDDLRRKNYEKTMNQLYPQKQALEAEQKKFQGAKKTLEKAKPGIAKMREQAKAGTAQGLANSYKKQGKMEHAGIATELDNVMKGLGLGFHEAVSFLGQSFEEMASRQPEDAAIFEKRAKILRDEVAGDMYDAMNKKAAPAAKKDALVKKINADPKLKAEVMSLKGKPKAAKPAKSESSDKPKTFFDKEKEKAEKSFDDFREIMQRRRGEIDVLNERLRTTKNSFIAKATKQELDRKLREYDELDQMY